MIIKTRSLYIRVMFHPKSPIRQLYLPIMLTMIIVVAGITGFYLIEGFNFFDSFYMTVITVATVGFQEVHPLSQEGRMFTSFLIIFSFGTFAYAITAISKYVVDGEFNKYYRNIRVTGTIEKLKGHVVICGFGRNGRQAAIQLAASGFKFVVIEKEATALNQLKELGHLFIEGDGTHDEILEKAGIRNAKALITTLPIDADNLFIVLSARSVNSGMTIISRASDENSDKKIKTAGADNVIMPDKIGGAHMASLVMKPDVIEFIDYITGQGGIEINLEEITFENLPESLQNKTIRDLEIRNKSGANIIGFKTAQGEYVINPSPDTKIIPDAKLFVLGTAEQITKLKHIFA